MLSSHWLVKCLLCIKIDDSIVLVRLTTGLLPLLLGTISHTFASRSSSRYVNLRSQKRTYKEKQIKNLGGSTPSVLQWHWSSNKSKFWFLFQFKQEDNTSLKRWQGENIKKTNRIIETCIWKVSFSLSLSLSLSLSVFDKFVQLQKQFNLDPGCKGWH